MTMPPNNVSGKHWDRPAAFVAEALFNFDGDAFFIWPEVRHIS